FASRNAASTCCVLLPMDETMPIPVTTTRLIFRLVLVVSLAVRARPPRSLGLARLRRGVVDQSDFEVQRLEDHPAIGRKPAVGYAKNKSGSHHAFDVDAIYDILHRRQHLPGKFNLAHAERTALARSAKPTEEEAEHLPLRVEPEAARHHRVALEMAREEP